MKKINLILVLLIATISSSFAQDTIQAMVNFDSLVNSFYVKKSLKIYSNENKTVFNDNHDINVSDSVVIARMKKIATPIQLTYNPEVKQWLSMYLKRGKYMIPTIMGLSNFYFPMFEKELSENNMPMELKYLPIIESALNPRAVSVAGATGLWQFIYPTGKRYGLEINSYIDERKSPQLATTAAVNYLKDLYGIFNDWNLALAAYNCGAGNVNKAIIRSGGKTNFWDIYHYLPRETRGYIPAFIAITYIMSYTDEHNFYPAKIDLPYNTDTLIITDTLHLLQVAEVIDIPMSQLRDLNPQYKIDIIPGYKKPYALRLPMDKIASFLINEDKIYDYKNAEIFSKKFIVKKTPKYNPKRNYSYKKPEPCPTYNFSGKGKVYYTVKSGDTFSFITGWFDVSSKDLKCWNKMTSTKLSAGQKLIIWEPLKKLTYYKKFNSLSFDKKQALASNKTVRKRQLNPNFIYYTIKSGDNLYTIASKFNGVSYTDLISINKFSNNDVDHLQINQVIKIKKKN